MMVFVAGWYGIEWLKNALKATFNVFSVRNFVCPKIQWNTPKVWVMHIKKRMSHREFNHENFSPRYVRDKKLDPEVRLICNAVIDSVADLTHERLERKLQEQYRGVELSFIGYQHYEGSSFEYKIRVDRQGVIQVNFTSCSEYLQVQVRHALIDNFGASLADIELDAVDLPNIGAYCD